ncbi:MAG: alcohol dehydrogenase catalytic domain-containing protein [Sphingomonadaceae bacterium]
MKAAVFKALHAPLEVQTVPDPEPGEGDVVISVGRCGICGSDLHMSEQETFGAKGGDVFGHEFAGEVVALGKGAEGLAVGDLVAVSPLRSCGTCEHCAKGEPQWCSGFGLQGGGYAEYALTRPYQCVKMPADTSLDDGAMAEPLAVALHGVKLSGMERGDKVLILGGGPIGLSVAFWARQRGASKVVVQDVADWQKERALSLGVDDFVVDREDPVGAAERALGGKADVVFECVGVPGLIAQAVQQVRNRGTILLLGLCTVPDTLNTFAMLNKEVKLVTSAFLTMPDFQESLDVLGAGSVEPRLMITDTVGLDGAPEAFEALKHRTHQCKTLIAPWAT